MNDENRSDLSYDLCGDPRLAERDGNKFTFKMNPKYGKGKSISIYNESGIYPVLNEFSLSFNIKKSIPFYKENAIYLAKVLEGNILIRNNDKLNILISEGDIFFISGNYSLNEKFIFEKEKVIKSVGLFTYSNELLNVFKKNNWNTDIIKDILYNDELKSGIKLLKTDYLDNILNDLYISMRDDNRFISYIKSMELFNCFLEDLNKNKHMKMKTYKEEQVENVIRIKKFLDENLDTYYSMPKLAKMFNISLSRMQSIFTDYYNYSPYKYHLHKRLERSNELILNTDIKITEIAKIVGFASYDNFFKAYKTMYGFTPSKQRMT